MADLIGGLLGYMKDPRRSQQMQGLAGLLTSANDRAKAFNQLNRAATEEFLQTKDIYGPKSQQVANLLAEGYNPVGMFIGPSSTMFNKDMALKASQMAKKGATPQEIWQTTGTVKGPDGQWRQEISDKESFVKGSQDFGQTIMNAYDRGSQQTGNQLYKTNVDDVFSNRELAAAYPELMGMETRTMRKGSDAYGSLGKDVLNNEQFLAVRKDLPPEKARSTMLHELQHAIQEQEGFAVGGNTNTMDRLIGKAKDRDFLIRQSEEWQNANKSVEDLYNKYFTNELTIEEVKAAEKQLQKQYPILLEQIDASDAARKIGSDPVDAYKRLIGEAEARLTQTRADLTPEQRRQYFPFEFQDEIRNPYGLDVPPEWLLNLDTQGRLIKSGLLD